MAMKITVWHHFVCFCGAELSGSLTDVCLSFLNIAHVLIMSSSNIHASLPSVYKRIPTLVLIFS